METIHNYEVPILDSLEISMPRGAHILCVQLQNSHMQPCIWARVNDQNPMVQRELAWRGTGHDCEDMPTAVYVGTVQFPGLVFHLFDLWEKHDE